MKLKAILRLIGEILLAFAAGVGGYHASDLL